MEHKLDFNDNLLQNNNDAATDYFVDEVTVRHSLRSLNDRSDKRKSQEEKNREDEHLKSAISLADEAQSWRVSVALI